MRVNAHMLIRLPIGICATAYLDGVKQNHAIEVDTDKGMILRAMKDENGHTITFIPGMELTENQVNLDGIVAEWVFGDVELKIAFDDLHEHEVVMVEQKS